MPPDNIDDELDIMEENLKDQGDSQNIESGIRIEDPIKTLDLNPVISVKTGTSIRNVINVLNQNHIGCVTVVDQNSQTIGIFTERDILRKIAGKGLDFDKEVVDSFMTRNPETLSENDPVAFALNKMSDGSYRHIPITRNKEVRFMLSVKDIVDQIAQAYRKKVLNLPPDLKQQVSEYGG